MEILNSIPALADFLSGAAWRIRILPERLPMFE